MKFQEYLYTEYSELYPAPKLHLVGLDWKFYASVIVAVAALILAALRTASMFYAAALLSAKVFGIDAAWAVNTVSFLDALVAMVAIEGGLVVYSAIRAVQRGRVDGGLLSLQIALLVVVSVVAGLGQSLGLIQGLPEEWLVWFTYVLAIVLGVGASIVAWLSGEVLGVQILRFEEVKTAADEKLVKSQSSWISKARSLWKERRVELLHEPKDIERSDAKEKVRQYILTQSIEHKVTPSANKIAKDLRLPPDQVWAVMEELKNG